MAPKRKGTDTPSATTTTRSTSVKATRSATRNGTVSLKPPMENPEPYRRSKKSKTEVPEVIDGPTRTISIEYCKKSGVLFKEKATEIKAGLEKELGQGFEVVFKGNARKGSFVISENGGEDFVNLLDLKKPFGEVDELDAEKVVSDIVAKIM